MLSQPPDENKQSDCGETAARRSLLVAVHQSASGAPTGRSAYRDGRIAGYCVTDVVNTYQVWLRFELFRGRLTEAEFQASKACRKFLIRQEPF